MKRLSRLWSDESGASAIELALLSALILVPLLLGSTEIGRRIWVKAQLDNAVRVGMDYVMANHKRCTFSGSVMTCSFTGTDLQNAARSATSLVPAITVVPPTACGSVYACKGCPTSTGVTPQSTTCSDGSAAGLYAGLTASYSYTPLFHACGGLLSTSVCPLTSTAMTLSSAVVARIK
jgi:Flp pilus assembly protein TadG